MGNINQKNKKDYLKNHKKNKRKYNNENSKEHNLDFKENYINVKQNKGINYYKNNKTTDINESKDNNCKNTNENKNIKRNGNGRGIEVNDNKKSNIIEKSIEKKKAREIEVENTEENKENNGSNEYNENNRNSESLESNESYELYLYEEYEEEGNRNINSENILIITYGEQEMKINLNKINTLEGIQKKIYKRFNIPLCFQKFYYRQIRDEDSFKEFLEDKNNFKYSNYIYLQLRESHKFEIIIENEYEFYLDIKYNDTIEVIKKNIQERLKVQCFNDLILYFNDIELKNNKKTLVDYNEENNNELIIKKKDYYNEDVLGIIQLMFKVPPKIMFIIEINGKIEQYFIYLFDKVKVLYEMLKEKIDFSNKTLYCNNRYLLVQESFIFNRIKNNDTICVADIPDFYVIIETVTHRKFTIVCEISDTIEQLRIRIQNAEEIPQDQQRLVYRGRQLEDRQTFAGYNIKKGDIIHLVLRLRG